MNESELPRNDWPLWEVFLQEEGGKPHTHAGSLHAADSEMALGNARDVYARRGRIVSIWVAESNLIAATTPADRPAFFEPSSDKIYRYPQFYTVPRGIRGM